MESLKQKITKENFRRKLHNEFVPKVQELLQPFVGKKITKIDGYAVSKLDKMIKELHQHKKSLNIYIKASYSCVRLNVRDSYYDEKDNIVYVDDAFLIGEYESKKSESGVLDHFTEFEPQEYLDYETELKKINAIQSTLDELQPQIEDLNWITRQELKDKNWRIFK